MKENLAVRAAVRVDEYVRKPNSAPAKLLRMISSKEGEIYRKSRTKKVVERTVAAVGSVVTLPLVVGLAVAIKHEDGGPVFFPDPRIGKNGEIFKMLKFRSLEVGADKDQQANIENIKSAGTAYDKRSTKVGARIRKWRLDELPQLWHVARGRMSLNGMRASNELTFALLREQRPEHADELIKKYLTVEPAAFNPVAAFDGGEGAIDKSYHLNSFYLRKASLGLDLYMIFRTFIRPLLDIEAAKKTQSVT